MYRKRCVRESCLTLQNLYGLDVNLLLFSCWHATTRGLFEPALAREALSFSAMWATHVVKPLRSARTWMKGNPAITGGQASKSDQEMAERFTALREQIKGLELQSEQFQETMLESLTRTPVQELETEIQIAAALYNLRLIIGAAMTPINTAMASSLATLILNTVGDESDEDRLTHQTIITEFTTCEVPPSA